jgi:hypothetical protein
MESSVHDLRRPEQGPMGVGIDARITFSQVDIREIPAQVSRLVPLSLMQNPEKAGGDETSPYRILCR